MAVPAAILIGHPGTNRVAFQGRISRHKKLKPGHYKLTATARSRGVAIEAKVASLYDRGVGLGRVLRDDEKQGAGYFFSSLMFSVSILRIPRGR